MRILSLHDALPIFHADRVSNERAGLDKRAAGGRIFIGSQDVDSELKRKVAPTRDARCQPGEDAVWVPPRQPRFRGVPRQGANAASNNPPARVRASSEHWLGRE